jgi:type II secretory pathway component PulM
MALQIDMKTVVEAVSEEITVVVNTLREKGAKRFGRALGTAGAVAAGAYILVYLPPQQKSARLQAEIDKARVLANYGSQYKDLRDQAALAYAGLPTLADREQWLANSVRDSLLAGGLEPENFTPVKESVANGLIFQVSSVSLTVRFAEFYDWLLRLENAKPLMHVQSVALAKIGTKLGYNAATCEVSTVIPKKRFR